VLSAAVDPVGLTVRIDADAPLRHGLESSADLQTWVLVPAADDVLGAGEWRLPLGSGRTFYRAASRSR
jgi:hypothetical protein